MAPHLRCGWPRVGISGEADTARASGKRVDADRVDGEAGEGA